VVVPAHNLPSGPSPHPTDARRARGEKLDRELGWRPPLVSANAVDGEEVHLTARQEAGRAVRGSMLWFDEAKDYGFILTDEGERLYVARDGFVNGKAPVGRCARLAVELSVGEHDGERVAVNVSLVEDEPQRRARRRTSAFRSSWS
jgi:hypothetical protein